MAKEDQRDLTPVGCSLIVGKKRSERSYTCTRFHCPLPYHSEMFCNCNLNNLINTARRV